MESIGSSPSVNNEVEQHQFEVDMDNFLLEAPPVQPQPRLLLLVSGRPLAAEVLDICMALSAHAEVKVVCTPDSVRYVSRPLLSRLFDVYSDSDFPEHPGHGAYYDVLLTWATALIFAPLSATYLAKVALGFSDDLFCQIANNWPYINIMSPLQPEVLLLPAKPAFVFVDMEVPAFYTHPTKEHLQQMLNKGALVMVANGLTAENIILAVGNQLGFGAAN